MKVQAVLLRSGLRQDGIYITREAILDLAARSPGVGYFAREADDGEVELVAELEVDYNPEVEYNSRSLSASASSGTLLSDEISL